jgi:hypothetical protein
MGGRGLSISGASQGNDYERACRAREYLEAIACAHGNVLVLGDEPLQSSFFRTADGDLAVARWVYARSREGVEEFLEGPAEGRSDLAPTVPFNVLEGSLVLFDSALRGTDALARCPTANMPPGSYRVTTEKRQLEGEFSFVVHRLRVEL